MIESIVVESFRGTRTNPDDLVAWTIYDHPTDIPTGYVVRPWRSLPTPQPSPMCAVAATLKEARELLPPGLTCLGRNPEDDPTIVETWI